MAKPVVSKMYLVTFQSLLHMVVSMCVAGEERSRLSNWRSMSLIYTCISTDQWTHE